MPGTPKTNRTSDLPLRRGLLYPLSYRGAACNVTGTFIVVMSAGSARRWRAHRDVPCHTSSPSASDGKPRVVETIRRFSSSARFVIAWLDAEAPFPPIDAALTDPNGLLAAGGDLSPARLIDAYRRGIYPWYSEGQPLLWWSPDPRMVLYIAEFRLSRSLAKRVRRREFDVRLDTAFDDVIEACATEPRDGQQGTWITRDMIDAYRRLHELGYAHSVEAWRDDQMVGGLYGIALGRTFFGESMFARVSDASKVCLASLVALLQQRGVVMIDCQQETVHLASLGARAIPRRAFARELGALINSNAPPPGWTRGRILESR
jgi:leucyl/phenylalanyl-tRNA---protein transferase